jgi:hypothetical protein
MFAQGRAITTGIETLTASIIESVAQDSLGIIQEFTEKHRLRGTHRIFRKAEPQQQTGGSDLPVTTADTLSAKVDTVPQESNGSEPGCEETQHKAAPAKPGRGKSNSRRLKSQVQDSNDIRSLGVPISMGMSAHEVFKSAGHIRDSVEFL